MTSYAESIATEGYAVIPSQILRGHLDVEVLLPVVEEWEELPCDEYVPEGGSYRFRRYGRLLALPDDRVGYTLKPLPVAAFRQAAAVIPLYQGQERNFASISESILAAPVLQELIKYDLGIVFEVEGHRRPYCIGLHMIRVVATSTKQGFPAPEGRHSDGHSYVAMHLIGRKSCTGGSSRVYLGKSSVPALVTTMQEFMDTIIIDDRRVEHEVTPVQAIGETGIRDTLLVDFDPEP
ncbi:MAG: 2OG-Fe dioxygenase family protein [Egibacteraceae bacterium]